jgi:hypothetical protein
MRLRIHLATANEELIALVNEGYKALSAVQADYKRRRERATFDDISSAGFLRLSSQTSTAKSDTCEFKEKTPGIA